MELIYVQILTFCAGFALGFPKSRNWLIKEIKQLMKNKKKNDANKITEIKKE